MPATGIVPTPTGDDFDQSPIGSGPWRFVEWSHDDYIVLAKNPAYWGSVPLADSMRIRIIPEPLTQAAEYERGGLSVVEMPFGETRRWEERHGAELKRRPTIRDLYIAINTTRGPLSDVRVRQALNLAVDVPTLLQTVMAGRGLQAHGVIPPGITGYDSARAPFPYDPDSARALLAAAGHASGLSLKLWRSQRPEYARIAQAVQQSLAAVGIQVEIVAARRVERPRRRPEGRGRPLPHRLVRRLSRSRELHLSALLLEERRHRRELRLLERSRSSTA